MGSIKANQMKRDMYVLYKDQPHQVQKCEFYFPGKGSAFARTKLKNVKTGNVYEYTYKSSESVETVDVDTVELQYLYADGDDYFFMNPRTYDQVTVKRSVLDGKEKFLLAEEKMFIIFYEDEAVGVRFPPKVKLRVTESQDAVAGNTVNAPKKEVTVETGAKVMVPIFIKQDETIIVDTDSGEYVSRAN